jgi:hypothetical protein
VYYKEWAGTVTATDNAITNFFPSPHCRIVSHGGSSTTENVDIDYAIPYYSSSNYYRSIYKSGADLGCKFAGGNTWDTIVWVKYINEEEGPIDEPDPDPPISPVSPPIVDPISPPIVDPTSPPIIDPITPPIEPPSDN